MFQDLWLAHQRGPGCFISESMLLCLVLKIVVKGFDARDDSLWRPPPPRPPLRRKTRGRKVSVQVERAEGAGGCSGGLAPSYQAQIFPAAFGLVPCAWAQDVLPRLGRLCHSIQASAASWTTSPGSLPCMAAHGAHSSAQAGAAFVGGSLVVCMFASR